MARPRAHLRNAPIAEALIDYRVVRREPIPADVFADLHPRIGEHYTRRSPLSTVEAIFGIAQGQVLEPRQVQAVVGWVYQGDTAVAQFRTDGFTFNKLDPYTTWEDVADEASRLWQLYCEISVPAEVSRLAVRYINRLRLPSSTELHEFLAAPPVLPAPIPQVVREFLTRVVVQDETRHASAIIVQALEASVDPGEISILLDIDAFSDVSLAPDDAGIAGIFEQLRQLKNEIFYATITDRTAEMYE